MKLKKRYIALALFAAFSVYNGIKGYNDDDGIKKAFDAAPAKQMQVTPGVAEYDELVGARINTLETNYRNDNVYTNKTAEVCSAQNANMPALLCGDFYEVRVSADAMKEVGVSFPQVVLGETIEEMKANKDYSVDEFDGWVELYSHLAALLKVKDGTEMLVKDGIMTADETKAIRLFLKVQYTDINQPFVNDNAGVSTDGGAKGLLAGNSDEPTTPGGG